MNLRGTASSSLRATGAAPPEAFWLPSWHAFIKTVELGSMAAAARALVAGNLCAASCVAYHLSM